MALRNNLMNFMCKRKARVISSKLSIPEPNFNTDFLCDRKNRDEIETNIRRRKGIGDIDKVLELSSNLRTSQNEERSQLMEELSRIPNLTHPDVSEYEKTGKIIRQHGATEDRSDFKVKSFTELAKSLKLLRTEDLGPIAGEKSYILLGDLAQLEEALIQYSIRKLINHHGFKLISVPDILPTKIIERCGMIIDGKRNLVYSLDNFYGDDLSLSGTAEMALATKLMNSSFKMSDLPVKLAAVSRCFRAEVSNSTEEQGIYRVHQFTKVEMFVCSGEENSNEIFTELTEIQEKLFSELGLPFQVIDMPPHELGAPAYRKFDIEGWLPGKKGFGELSSCSNCTDYQARRLNITYKTEEGNLKYAHTLNGTACAIPRTLIAICENFQTADGKIRVPEKLLPFMNGKTLIGNQKIPNMRDYKYKNKN